MDTKAQKEMLIELIKNIPDEGVELYIEPPHIEEIGGTIECMYGVMKARLEITYNGTYKRVIGILEDWKKIKKK